MNERIIDGGVEYCVYCHAERPDDSQCSCQSFDGLVDKLMALRGLARDEAETLAEDILEDDAA